MTAIIPAGESRLDPLDYPTPSMLRAARALIGVTQDEIARRMGLSQRSVVAVESYKSSLRALHAVLGYYATQGIVFSRTADNKEQVITYRPRTPAEMPDVPTE